jgi:hypothetical protein
MLMPDRTLSFGDATTVRPTFCAGAVSMGCSFGLSKVTGGRVLSVRSTTGTDVCCKSKSTLNMLTSLVLPQPTMNPTKTCRFAFSAAVGPNTRECIATPKGLIAANGVCTTTCHCLPVPVPESEPMLG